MEKRGIRVRFPNEIVYDNVTTFQIENFQLKNTFEKEVFGKWIDAFVFIDIDDYNRLKNEQINE
jgi:hypothetical protein